MNNKKKVHKEAKDHKETIKAQENHINPQENNETFIDNLNQSKQYWESNVISLSKNYLNNETEIEKKIAQLDLEKENDLLLIDQLNNELEALEEKDEKLKENSLEKIKGEISLLTETNKLLESKLINLEMEVSLFYIIKE